MGLGGISIWQLLIVLAIIILLFGTKRLRSFGSDLGGAVKGFRKSMNANDEDGEEDSTAQLEEDKDVIDSTAEKTRVDKEKQA